MFMSSEKFAKPAYPIPVAVVAAVALLLTSNTPQAHFDKVIVEPQSFSNEVHVLHVTVKEMARPEFF